MRLVYVLCSWGHQTVHQVTASIGSKQELMKNSFGICTIKVQIRHLRISIQLACLSKRCHFSTDEVKATSNGRSCFIHLVYRNLWFKCKIYLAGQHLNNNQWRWRQRQEKQNRNREANKSLEEKAKYFFIRLDCNTLGDILVEKKLLEGQKMAEDARRLLSRRNK